MESRDTTKRRHLPTAILFTVGMVMLAGCQDNAEAPITSASSASVTTAVATSEPSTVVPTDKPMTSAWTGLGKLEWFASPTYPGRVASFEMSVTTRLQIDGRYYAKSDGRWWISADGIEWSRQTSPPPSTPTEFNTEGSNFQVFEDEGETWAIVDSTNGRLRLLHKEGANWVKASVTLPKPPPGHRVRQVATWVQ